jgi:nicotinate-nucleotide adenylyltransferase
VTDGPREGPQGIGVLGGSFDPIHLAHLRLAEQARETLELEQVIFVPAGRSPLKDETRAGAAERLAMARLATASNPHFGVDALELERAGPSYTYDTLGALRERHPGKRLWFLLGSDVLAEFDAWYRGAELFELASFAVAGRGPATPGRGDAGELLDLLPASLRSAFEAEPTDVGEVAGLRHRSGERLVQLPFAPLDISATDVRQRVARRASVRYLVPDAVLEYIEKAELYRP